MSIFSRVYSRIMGIGAVQRQSIISFIWQIAYTFVGFLSTIYFAHTLGATILGSYFLFVAYFSVIGLISEGGLSGGAIKRISEGNDPDCYFSAFFLLRSLFLISSIIILVIIRNYLSVLDFYLYSWLLLAMAISFLLNTVQVGIAGRDKMGIYSTSNFINNMSRILFQILAVLLGFEAAGLAGGFVAGMLVAAIVGLRFFDLRLVRFHWDHIMSLSSFSFWLFLTSSGVMVYSYADTIMIGYFMNNADVGIYRVAFQFASFALIATTEIRGVLWPKISSWGQASQIELIEKSLSRALNYSLLFSIPITIGGILLGDNILSVLYGVEFEKGYSTLVVLLIVQVVNVFQFLFTTYLGALDMQKEAFKLTAVSSIANIFLNIILIPLIGIFGAAVATLITMILNALLASKALSQIISVNLEYGCISNILKASVTMAFLLGVYRLYVPITSIFTILLAILFGGIIFSIMILKLDRSISNELREIAKNLSLPWPDWL